MWIEYQRGEPLRIVRVYRESADDGETWTRLDLTGMHYARDIRTGPNEGSALVLACRDDDENAYVTIQGETVTLDDEVVASPVGVVVIIVPADIATTALPEGRYPTDVALVDEAGDSLYTESGSILSRARVTVP